ncbi:hypothetical protein NEFER03_0670 [Nematocida sp. LUAm3]|nr:hypothetical protein NEFER03_0670 [Nematocida sp. LUAm3]KAI5175129.1 hypothetical protein NEFER02_1090 [Nematocida sp. LUAm2]KAI5178199.1 hypothetical protein NEFER01_1377 [Nematocida sp. LUAm1]
MAKSIWTPEESSERIKEKLLGLVEKNYMDFLNKACKVSFPRKTKKVKASFRFSDVFSYNYEEIKERYSIEEELNASLIPHKRDFIAMEYPTDLCVENAANLVEKTKCSVVISLIGMRYEWESDFLREKYLLVERVAPVEFLQYAQEYQVDVDKTEYKDIEGILKHQNEKFSIEVYYSKNGKKKEKPLFRINCNSWKDKTPPCVYTLKALDILYYICRTITQIYVPESPVVVHCLAGVGRTGTFIFYTMFRSAILQKEIDEENLLNTFIDLFLFLRSKRTWMIEMPSQLNLLYEIFILKKESLN